MQLQGLLTKLVRLDGEKKLIVDAGYFHTDQIEPDFHSSSLTRRDFPENLHKKKLGAIS